MTFSFFYSRGGSGYVRGYQMAEALGGKHNPKSGFENDICIYVKILPPDNYPKHSYMDVDDAPKAVNWLMTHKDIGVIAISKRAKRKLEQLLPGRKIILIPHQHVNFERWTRPDREVKVVGIIGSTSSFQSDIEEFRTKLSELGLELKYEEDYWNTYKTDQNKSMREKICDFHKEIDIQVVWRPRRDNSIKDMLRNPNKLGNAASFGIPTVSYPEENFEEEWDGLYLPALTIDQMIFQIRCLKDSKVLYRNYSISGLLRAEKYHMDNIMKRYLEL